MIKKIICALDTSELSEAESLVRKLRDHVGAFKIGHALTLRHGLDVVDRLQDAGASRIFLDLKFHDIPNSVAIAVREAAKRKVWMMTIHTAGGPAMMNAAVEEAQNSSVPPLVVGVSVLTSLDQSILSEHLAISRSLEEHMVYLSKLAMECELDGVVCSAHEISPVRQAIRPHGIIVTPGIRIAGTDADDQRRVGDANRALNDGANYLVIGRALTSAPDPAEALASFQLARHSA